MIPKTENFRKKAIETLNNPSVQHNLGELYNGFHYNRLAAAAATDSWTDIQAKGRAIKAHVIDNLDHYLSMVETNIQKAGGVVHFARTAEEATDIVLNLAATHGVKLAIKSKSMVSEEIGLNASLKEKGIEPVETDLGEYIVQLAEEAPYHIIAPAIHKSKEDVSRLFQEKLHTPRYTEPVQMASEARKQLRQKFIEADMGITGANFLIAETGTLVLVTNEGNGRMCTSMPRIHVAITGMEKIIPSIEDLSLFLRLLIRSATGQWLSSYVTTVTGPKRNDDEDGPEEFHLVIVDNGRSRLLKDPDLREALYCIRCGACLNACPVYRKVGGHAYGWAYPGPIGAVITPVLTGLAQAKDLPFASSLCGACKEACPVKIDIPKMLLNLRRQLSENKVDEGKTTTPISEKLLFRMWRITMCRPVLARIVGRIGYVLQLPLASHGRIRWSLWPLSSWRRYRTLPSIARIPFHRRWKNDYQ